MLNRIFHFQHQSCYHYITVSIFSQRANSLSHPLNSNMLIKNTLLLPTTIAGCRKRPPSAVGARVRFYSRKHGAKARYECYRGFRMKLDLTHPSPSDRPGQATQRLHPLSGDLRDMPIGTIQCIHGEWIGNWVYCETSRCLM